MKVSDLKQSRFLTQDDCDPPIRVTISHVDQQNVAPADQKAEQRWVMHFKEDVKPLVLNATNGETIAAITGSDDSDGWTGKTIVLYKEPSIKFAGKTVGGIRVRAPAQQPTQTEVTLPTEDVPW